MSNTVFGVETAYGVDFPDHSVSTDSGSDVDTSTKEVLNDPSTIVKRKGRGKALKWEEHLLLDMTGFIVYPSLDDVRHDAAISDYSKVSSVDLHHKYRCKFNGCAYMRRYEKDSSMGHYISYFNGLHHHVDPTVLTPETHRGLTGEQKLLVHEAIDQEKMSSRKILSFFRLKRAASLQDSAVRFPDDPDIMKLNNYIQAHKRKNLSTYNPSPNDLKLWCMSHGPLLCNLTDESNFNDPFVLNYALVRTNVKLVFSIFQMIFCIYYVNTKFCITR
jgi:hypothetical protein